MRTMKISTGVAKNNSKGERQGYRENHRTKREQSIVCQPMGERAILHGESICGHDSQRNEEEHAVNSKVMGENLK